MRQGSQRTDWLWEEAKLTVTGLDGHKEEYMLKSAPKEVAQQPQPRRVSNQGWGPYGDGRRRQQPRSFFDMLFGGN